jgi:CheY-like chemotaxis protein
MANFLLVDDDQVTLNLLHLIISNSYKYSEVTSVRSNEEAYCILKSSSPDLIITDINRPNEGGYEFLTKLRQLPHTKSIPVIAVSATSKDEHEELKQYRHGFNAVLPKPFSTSQLFETLNKLLDLHVDPSISLLLAGQERQDLDYKESFDFISKDTCAALAKDVIAMANWGGGVIVVGVSEPIPGQFVLTGLKDEVLPDFEVTRLNNAIRGYIDPHVHVTSKILTYDSRKFVELTVPAVKDTLILAKKQNDKVRLFQGRIYTRNASAESAEVQTSAELRELLLKLNS